MGNEIEKLNAIAAASLEKVNGIAAGSITHINGLDLVLTVDQAVITSHREAAGATSTGVSMTYDEDNNYVYVQYNRNGGGGAASVGSFNTTDSDVDFGSAQTIESSNAFSGNSCDYDKYNNRVWSAWIGGGDNTIYARCGTINGPVVGDSSAPKTISWGTTLTIQTGNNTIGKYNQGLLHQGLAVDQSTGKCLVVWNNGADNISGASNHHPNAVILTVDTSNNSITKSSAVRMATGGSGQGFPIIKCHYDPDNTEWVAITDANNTSTGIYALRITNSSGNPAAANQEQLLNNSSHHLQGDGSGDHNATKGVTGGRYGGQQMIYDTNVNRFIIGSATADGTTPAVFAFQNTGSGITWDEGGQAVSHGTAISSSGRGGAIAFSHARNKFASHGSTGSVINLEIFSYDGTNFTSHNSGSLVTIVSDDDGLFRGTGSMQDMSAFASGAIMFAGTDYDSKDAYYYIIELGS